MPEKIKISYSILTIAFLSSRRLFLKLQYNNQAMIKGIAFETETMDLLPKLHAPYFGILNQQDDDEWDEDEWDEENEEWEDEDWDEDEEDWDEEDEDWDDEEEWDDEEDEDWDEDDEDWEDEEEV
ncbi:MAG: hypothetical protein J0L94_11845 [Rhodothermia bacterium]|nr:hypothetical protein [Rhodothermia bacterium]